MDCRNTSKCQQKKNSVLQLFCEWISVVLLVSDSLSFLRFQTSAVVYLRPLLFWDVTWHRMAAVY